MAPGTRRKVRTTRSSQADQELSAKPTVTRRESLNMEERDENKPDEPHNSDGGNDRVLDPPILQAKRTKTARARQSKLSDVSNRRDAQPGSNKIISNAQSENNASPDPAARPNDESVEPPAIRADATVDKLVDTRGSAGLEEEMLEQGILEKNAVPAPVAAASAQDLAAAAREAALNHAAQDRERELQLAGKPRLVIHQLVLENFKSYKGREVIGPFHKSFSAIVGPNGSGKSNTIDALLFVFGYRATKMREGKLSELIHNSGASVGESEQLSSSDESADSDSSQPAKSKKASKKAGARGKVGSSHRSSIASCTVEVWFREIIDLEDRDAYQVVPGSELVVARTATRENTSHYTINGRTSNFTEVTTLLKARGIDLDHKRFLILQGEVESIAQMKPKSTTGHDEGLLEYLEDIIGTSHYKSEIERALAEVERLNEERQVHLNRVKVSEREKAGLEDRKKDADQYLRDQNELASHQSALYQRYVFESLRNTAEYEALVDEARKTLDQEISSQSEVRDETETLRSEYESLAQDTKEAQNATNEVVQQLAILEKAEVQLSERSKALTQKIKKVTKTIAEDKRRRSEAESTITNSAEEIQRLANDISQLERELAKEETELESVRDGLRGKTEVFSRQIESLEMDLQPWTAKLASKRSETELMRNEYDLLVGKQRQQEANIVEVNALLEALESERHVKNDMLDSLLTEERALKQRQTKISALIQTLDVEHLPLKKRALASRQKLDEAKASQAASKTQGGVLDSLNKLRDQGRLPGFHGRLGSLATIPDKYDVAISTACGGLDNLVAETIETGQLCIDHLRKHQLGRAQIMCLDKLARRDMSRIETPENAPRLFDLLKPVDEKFLPAFFQLLTNTLVAENLEQGKRLAFSTSKRWRVVTLDGQLIDTSGTMSGGGGRPQKGKMSAKITSDPASNPQMIAHCEADFETAQEALQQHLQAKTEAQAELDSIQNRLPQLEVELSKVRMDLDGLAKRHEAAQERAKAQKTQPSLSKPEAARLDALTKQIDALSSEQTDLSTKCDEIERQIQQLQERILEVGGVKLRTQQGKVADLRAQIEHNLDRTTKAEVALSKAEKDVLRLAGTLRTNEASLSACQDELRAVETQIASTVNDKKLVQDSVERAQDVLTEKNDELATIKAALGEREKAMSLFKKRQFDLENHLKTSVKALEESTKAHRHWSAKLEELTWNDVESDDEDGQADSLNDPATAVSKRSEGPSGSQLRRLPDDEVEAMDDDSIKTLKGQIAALEERIANSQLDLSVLKEYQRREAEFMQRAAGLEAITQERDQAKKASEDLRNARLRNFMAGFGIISMKLKEMYQMITLGGNAELELVDSLDPFSEGIIFSVMPPKKSWKNISNLSGGEKTLSSLALVFALHVYKPTPLYFMDEIDAALDFRNVSIVANYIRDRTKHAQFIIISLRNNMFELSSRLVGIYKVANQTRSIAIDNAELEVHEES